jgi:hypothetical protein
MEIPFSPARKIMFARLASFLSVFSVFSVYFLTLIIIHFIPPAQKGILPLISMLNFSGIILGAVLCPVFLPLPARGKPLLPGIGFIFLLILPQIIIRSLGAEFWLGGRPAQVLISLV